MMRIDLTCEACGDNRFSFPRDGGDDAVVTCGECGHVVGTIGAMKDEVIQAVLGKVAAGKAAIVGGKA